MKIRTFCNQRFVLSRLKTVFSIGNFVPLPLIFVFAVALALTGCGRTEEYVPCEGDLVFQIGNGSDFSDAIVSATGDRNDNSEGNNIVGYEEISNQEEIMEESAVLGDGSVEVKKKVEGTGATEYVHVGIVTIIGGNTFVLEASARDGVVLTSWKDFVEHSPMAGERPGLTVMRVREDFPVAAALARAMEHLGEPYDWYYMADNGRMYCSELVYDSYLREDGSHIFTANPMNFRDSDGGMPDFWTDLFSELGEPVPEGELGTNPNDLSRDPALIEVYRFF